MAYTCICEPRTLLQAGCKCGAFAAQAADEEAVDRVAAYEAKERLRKMRDFLIPEPTPPITWKKLCPTCLHSAHGGDWVTGNNQCRDLYCTCTDSREVDGGEI